MDAGVIVEEGKPDQLLFAPRTERVRASSSATTIAIGSDQPRSGSDTLGPVTKQTLGPVSRPTSWIAAEMPDHHGVGHLHCHLCQVGGHQRRRDGERRTDLRGDGRAIESHDPRTLPGSSLSRSFPLAHRYRGPAFELKVVGPSMLGIGCPGRHALPLTHPPPSPKMHRPRRASSRESGFLGRFEPLAQG